MKGFIVSAQIICFVFTATCFSQELGKTNPLKIKSVSVYSDSILTDSIIPFNKNILAFAVIYQLKTAFQLDPLVKVLYNSWPPSVNESVDKFRKNYNQGTFSECTFFLNDGTDIRSLDDLHPFEIRYAYDQNITSKKILDSLQNLINKTQETYINKLNGLSNENKLQSDSIDKSKEAQRQELDKTDSILEVQRGIEKQVMSTSQKKLYAEMDSVRSAINDPNHGSGSGPNLMNIFLGSKVNNKVQKNQKLLDSLENVEKKLEETEWTQGNKYLSQQSKNNSIREAHRKHYDSLEKAQEELFSSKSAALKKVNDSQIAALQKEYQSHQKPEGVEPCDTLIATSKGKIYTITSCENKISDFIYVNLGDVSLNESVPVSLQIFFTDNKMTFGNKHIVFAEGYKIRKISFY